MLKYYDIKYTLARGSPINMIIGQRGCGKTYSTTKYILENYQTNKEKFLYIRRNRNQIAPAAKNFFADYSESYPVVAAQKEFKHGKHTIGYYCNLSEAQTLKSGFDLKSVTTILFDEVVERNPEKYLIAEYIQFADLLDTVLRLRNNAKVIFLGNSYSIYNPYTLQWGTTFSEGQTKWVSNDNFFRVELVQMPSITQARRESIVGRFSEDTIYDDMATNNCFIQDLDTQVRKRTGKCVVDWSISHNGTEYFLWHEWNTGDIIIDTSGTPSRFRFTVDKNFVGKTYKYIVSYPEWIYKFRQMYGRGRIYFNNKSVRSQFLQVMKYL